MTNRRLAILAVPILMLAVTSCSTSTEHGSAAGSAHTESSGPVSSSADSSIASTPQMLASRLQSGVLGVRSAHVTLHATTAGQTATGGGVEQLAGGKLVALELSETVPEFGDLRVIEAGGKVFADLPGAPNASGKPYVLVTRSSTNPTVRALADVLPSTQSSASVNSATTLVLAASSLRNLGASTAAGVSVTRYHVIVSVSRLPTGTPSKSLLSAAGVNTLPLDLSVDASGRPVQITETVTLRGERTTSTITFGQYNQPVSITAPPASQVGTG